MKIPDKHPRLISAILSGLAGILLVGCTDEPRITTSSPEALRLYNESVSLFEKFYYREAHAAIDSAIMADSMFAMAWARRGMISFYMKEAGEKDLDRAVELSANASRSEQMLIRMWRHRLHFEMAKAAALADSVIAEYPVLREAYLFRGQMYEWEQNNDAAVKMYERAILVDSTYAQAIMSVGYYYSGIGEFDRAAEYMERYIRLMPDEGDPRASLGDILVRAGKYDEALEQYRKSLEVKPDYWYAVEKIGDVFVIQGRLNAASIQYTRSRELLPRGSRGGAMEGFIAGRLNYLRGHYKEAAENFSTVLSIDSTFLDAAYGLARSFVRLKNLDAAQEVVDHIQQALKRRSLLESPAGGPFHLMRANILNERGNHAEALDACRDAIAHAPLVNRVSIFNQVANIYLNVEDYEPAIGACEEALSINPNYPETLLMLTRVYSAQKDMRMAREIGGRLRTIWKDADPDFVPLRELQQIIGRGPAASR